MVAPVFNVAVLRGTVRAHGKIAHGGFGPVIGHVFYNGKARAAVGAVNERVAEAPVVFVEKLTQAVITDGNVRRDECIARGLGLALSYLKAAEIFEPRGVILLHALDYRELRRPFGQLTHEALKHGALALKLQLHAGGGIFDIAIEPEAAHKLVYERAKAHALYNSVYFQFKTFHGYFPNDR